eukprot:gene10344-10501_t
MERPRVAMSPTKAVANFYMRLCKQLGCAPAPQFLRSLLLLEGDDDKGRVCRLSGAFTHPAASAIGCVLPHAGFKEIIMSEVQLPADGWVSLLEGVARCKKLVILSLRGCCLGSMTKLGPGRLEHLDISCNRLQSRGAAALAAAVKSHPLAILKMGRNQISNEGILDLAAALASSWPLRCLDLSHNKLSGPSLAVIANALCHVSGSLQELAIAGASGSELDVLALLQAVQHLKQLKLLDIRGAAVGSQAVDALCELLGESAVPLVTLCLDVASPAAAQAIAIAIQSSCTLLHATIGGCVPDQSLSLINNTLHARREELKAQSSAAPATTDSVDNGGDGAKTASIRLRGQQQNQKQRKQRQQWRHDQHVQPPIGAQQAASSPASTPAVVGSSTALQSAAAQPACASGVKDKPSACINAPKSLLNQERSWSVVFPPALGPADATAAKAVAVFKRHDTSQQGCLSIAQTISALGDLGMLEGLKAQKLGKFAN